jgi:hypothetical protein
MGVIMQIRINKGNFPKKVNPTNAPKTAPNKIAPNTLKCRKTNFKNCKSILPSFFCLASNQAPPMKAVPAAVSLFVVAEAAKEVVWAAEAAADVTMRVQLLHAFGAENSSAHDAGRARRLADAMAVRSEFVHDRDFFQASVFLNWRQFLSEFQYSRLGNPVVQMVTKDISLKQLALFRSECVITI